MDTQRKETSLEFPQFKVIDMAQVAPEDCRRNDQQSLLHPVQVRIVCVDSNVVLKDLLAQPLEECLSSMLLLEFARRDVAAGGTDGCGSLFASGCSR